MTIKVEKYSKEWKEKQSKRMEEQWRNRRFRQKMIKKQKELGYRTYD